MQTSETLMKCEMQVQSYGRDSGRVKNALQESTSLMVLSTEATTSCMISIAEATTATVIPKSASLCDLVLPDIRDNYISMGPSTHRST